jgi:hypothetical protein
VKKTLLDEFLARWKRVRSSLLRNLQMRAKFRVKLVNRQIEEDVMYAKVKIMPKTKKFLFVNSKIGEHKLITPILNQNHMYIYEKDAVSIENPTHFLRSNALFRKGEPCCTTQSEEAISSLLGTCFSMERTPTQRICTDQHH